MPRFARAIDVVGRAETGVGGGVEQGVAGSGVEGKRGRVRGEHGDVGDPAEVEGGRRRVRIGQRQPVENQRQRRSVPTRRDIAGSQVGDHREPGRLRDPCGLSDLEGAPAVDPVEQGLPECGDQVGPVGPDRDHGLRERLPHSGVQLAQCLGGTVPGRQGGGQRGPQLTGVGDLGVSDRDEVDHVAADVEVGDGHVDTVHRSTGVHPDDAVPTHCLWSIAPVGPAQELTSSSFCWTRGFQRRLPREAVVVLRLTVRGLNVASVFRAGLFFW